MTEFEKGICRRHSGKMEGMISYSTSCLDNKFCECYAKDCNKVCSKCYARTTQSYRKTLTQKNTRNGKYIKYHPMTEDEIPFINVVYFRFEAFGDIETETQVINYFNVAKANPKCTFALWTKNPWLIQIAIDHGAVKPDNFKIIVSSPYLNEPANINAYGFIDKIFTVYTKEYIAEHNIEINCGDKKCMECRLCYDNNNETNIREKLK